MGIAIIGSRGIPARYGGFETFAEVLAEKLTGYGFRVTVYTLYEYKDIPINNQEIRRVFIRAPKISFLEKVFASSASIIKSSLERKNQAIIFLGISGGLMMWLPRLFRMRTIVNVDGIEWKRLRWSPVIRSALKTLEYLAIKLADVVVADSRAIGDYVLSAYRKSYVFIPYGVDSCEFTEKDWKEVSNEYKIERSQYYLIVGRDVPENNFDMCIQGFLQSKSHRQLVIVSNLKDRRKDYNKKIIFTGPIYDRSKLYALRANASAYIHGHSVGGTNPSLLEAISSKNIIFAYDVPFNREVLQEFGFYFRSNKELTDLIRNYECGGLKIEKRKIKEYYNQVLITRYNWDIVIKKYLEILTKG